jgi:membrane glycosyltransferase
MSELIWVIFFIGAAGIFVLVGVIIKQLLKERDRVIEEMKKKLEAIEEEVENRDTLVRIEKLMIDNKEEREREEWEERESRVVVEKSNKSFAAPPMISVGGHEGEEWVQDIKHKKAEMLIPQNLSEDEKAVLREFYNL